MRKIVLPALIFMTLLIASAVFYLWLSIPQKIENNIQQTFIEAGFENTILPPVTKRIGHMSYENIRLDEDGFSTIQTLKLSYTPVSAIFGTIDTITLDGIDFTGELSEDGNITIAGWNNKTLEIKAGTWPVKAQRIEIENAKLSLLSEKWGGMSLQGDVQLTPSEQGLLFQARLKGAQKQLSADMSIDGQITNEGFWDAGIELEQGKFELDAIRVTRIAGLINLRGDKSSAPQIRGELQAGGLNLFGTAWQNGAITLDGTIKQPKGVLAAKSSGIEGLELGLNINDIHTPHIFSGHIHIEKLSQAFDYLNSQNKLPFDREALNTFNNKTALNLHFENKNELKFNFKNEEKNIDIKGNISQKSDSTYSGTFVSTPTQAQASSLPDIQGQFTYKDEKIDGNASIQLQNTTINLITIPLSLNGNINIDNLQNLSGPTKKDIECTIRDLKPKTTCSVNAKIANGTPSFSDFKITAPGITVKAPQLTGSVQKTLLNISEIDIKPFLSLFNGKDWKGTGLLSGTLSVQNEQGQMEIHNLHLKNKGVGILQIADEKLFELMEIEELERETMKLALENFHYDLLEIKASGAYPDQIKISVFGKGKNPELMQGRAFSIDFEITPDLSKLVKGLVDTQG